MSELAEFLVFCGGVLVLVVLGAVSTFFQRLGNREQDINFELAYKCQRWPYQRKEWILALARLGLQN